MLSGTYLFSGQYDRAIAKARQAPNHTDTQPMLGLAYLGKGKVEKAVEVFEENLRLQGRRPRQLSNLAVAYYKTGRAREGDALLQKLLDTAQQRYVTAELIADVHFAAGGVDAGFAAMQEVVEARGRGAIFIQTSLSLDGHRSDPRYRALVEAVGF